MTRYDNARADLVAAKDLEIETLAEASLRDMREIARLRDELAKAEAELVACALRWPAIADGIDFAAINARSEAAKGPKP